MPYTAFAARKAKCYAFLKKMLQDLKQIPTKVILKHKKHKTLILNIKH